MSGASQAGKGSAPRQPPFALWPGTKKALGGTSLLLSLGVAQPTAAKVLRGVAWLGPWAVPEGPCPVPGTAPLVIPASSRPSQRELPQLSLALGHSKDLLPKLASPGAKRVLKITLWLESPPRQSSAVLQEDRPAFGRLFKFGL